MGLIVVTPVRNVSRASRVSEMAVLRQPERLGST